MTKKKTLIGLVVMVVLAAMVVTGILVMSGCSTENKVTYKDGTYAAQDTEFYEGYKGVATVTVEKGAITKVTYDSVNEKGEFKSQLSAEGKYVMTETGKKWHEQIESLVANVVKNQSLNKIKVDDEGKTDSVAGVSINIKGFINLVEKCLNDAKEGKTGTTTAPVVQSALKDGTYTAEDAEYSNDYKGVASVTVKDGKITTITYDNLKADGTKKSQLSVDGQYIMTETGPKWHEQINALVNYVIEKQSVEAIKMNAEGKTDSVATVSINVKGFVNLLTKCLEQASK